MKDSIKQLHEKVCRATKEAQDLAAKYENGDTWTSEDEQAYTRACDESDRLQDTIDKIVRADKLAARLEEPKDAVADKILSRDTAGDDSPDGPKVSPEELQNLAFRAFLRGKHATKEEREAAQRVGIDYSKNAENDFVLGEQRAQSVGLGSGGGFSAPQGVMQPLNKALLQFGAVRPYATVIRTTNGNTIPIPTVDDTANTGSDLGENAAASTTDVTFGQRTLGAYKLSSDIVKVSSELLEDSALNISQIVGELLGERLARRSENKYAVGTGAGDIYGFTTLAATGKTTASATAITVDELLDLIDSVDPAYHMNARFMMHHTIKTAVRKLKDGNGQYLWQAAVQAGDPSTLLGFPVAVNQEMASAIATTNKTVAFGDFSNYWIRDVNDVRLARMDERFIDSDQVGFLALLRTDGLLNTNGNPVKLLVQA